MTIEVFCDGSGTYGPDSIACIGVVVFEDGVPVVEVSQCVGPGTNNVAELRALWRAMALLDWMYGLDVEATIFADSSYAIGQTTNRWNVNANHAIIERMRVVFDAFAALHVEHVRGHAGTYGNELADYLAHIARHRALGRPVTRKRPMPLP